MNTPTCSRIEVVQFDRLADDLRAVDALVGFALVKVDTTPLPPIAVYRAADRRLVVAIPVDAREFALPWPTQRQLARLVRRCVRRLERDR